MPSFSTNFLAPNGTLLTAFSLRFYAAFGNLVIDTNQACGTSSGSDVDVVGVTGGFSPNQFAEGRVGTLGGVSYAGLAARVGAPGSGNGYWWLGTPGASFFGYIAAGVFTALGTPPPFSAADFLRLEVDAGDIFSLFTNSVLVATFTDSTFPTGQPGIAGFRNDLASGMVNLNVGDLHPAPSGAGLWLPSFVGGV